jgi:hypothetical protein
VVNPAPVMDAVTDMTGVAGDPPASGPGSGSGQPSPGAIETDEGGMSRINLRLSDQLKSRVEQAAASEGLSVNAWLVRAAMSALEKADAGRRGEPRGRARPGGQGYVGWGR